jgi:hypothetical protein
MIVVAFNMIGTSAIGFLAAMTTFFSKIVMSWNTVIRFYSGIFLS